jgi:hypothetical protein
MGWEAEVEARKQQFVLQTAEGKNKKAVREEGEWSSGGMPIQWQK